MALAEARERLQDLQQEAARIGEEHSALRVDLAGFEERKRAEQIAALAHREPGRRESRGASSTWRGELERLGAEKTRLLADNVELDARAAELVGVRSRCARQVEARLAGAGDADARRRSRRPRRS